MTKVCNKCGIEKDISLYYKSQHHKSGINNKCSDCFRPNRRKRDSDLRVGVTHKRCCKCKEVKTFDGFYKHKKSKDGFRTQCVSCMGYTRRPVEADSRIGITHKRCSHCKEVKELSLFSGDKFLKNNKSNRCSSCISIYRKNKKPALIKSEKICSKCMILKPASEFGKSKRGLDCWCKKCRGLYANRYNKNRYSGNLNIRIIRLVRGRIIKALFGKKKTCRSAELLGCSIEFYRKYLEDLFPSSCNWDNFGKEWQIDHIRSCCLFDLSNQDQQKECFNYKNTRPIIISDHKEKTINDIRLSIQMDRVKGYVSSDDLRPVSISLSNLNTMAA